jgi:hypothetical protein
MVRGIIDMVVRLQPHACNLSESFHQIAHWGIAKLGSLKCESEKNYNYVE